MKTYRFCFLFFFSTVSLPSQPKIELRYSSLVSQERLQKTVRDLVEFGNRQGGTPSGDRAAAYLSRQFKHLGLQVEILEDPEALAYINDSWTLDVVKPVKLRGIFSHAWLAGFSPSSHRTRARLVKVPNNGDLSSVNVDSAAVLVDVDNSVPLYDELARKGAVCLLTWSEAKSKAYENCAYIQNLAPRGDNPLPVFDISKKSARLLARRLDSKQGITIEFSSRTRIRMGKPRTVVATLAGKSERYFIVCAHGGDANPGGPGADDNASGDAGVLEIAQDLVSLRRAGALPRPRYTIKFIVWGTERTSAEHFVKMKSQELRNIVGVLNIDEIGTGASRRCIYFEGNDQRVNFELLKTLQTIGEDYAGKKSFWNEATTNSSQGGTDSYVFLPKHLSRLGVPVVEIPSVTIFTAAWNEPKSLYQPEEWRSKAWKGPKDSVWVDYSLYYHSSMDVPATTTDVRPFEMVWGSKSVGIALLRLAWE